MASAQFNDITDISSMSPNTFSALSLFCIASGLAIICFVLCKAFIFKERAPSRSKKKDAFTEAIEFIKVNAANLKELPANVCAQKLSFLLRASLKKELNAVTLYKTRDEIQKEPSAILNIEDVGLAHRCQELLFSLWDMQYRSSSPNLELSEKTIIKTRELLEDIKTYSQ